MIETPEAVSLARQLRAHFSGKRVTRVVAWQNPHKLAFIYGDPAQYHQLLSEQSIRDAQGFGSWVEVLFDDVIMAVSEGTSLLAGSAEDIPPKKHQLLMHFSDGFWLCAAIKMYGGIVCARHGEYDNEYYQLAKQRPSAVSEGFDRDYFATLLSADEVQKLSCKAFLATKQRIPGLGNGVLQDILFQARLHPKRKVSSLSAAERESLFSAVTNTVQAMIAAGGRDTEKDLFGRPCGYTTLMSKHTVGRPCPECAATITKASYMGGSIYFCPKCQPL